MTPFMESVRRNGSLFEKIHKHNDVGFNHNGKRRSNTINCGFSTDTDNAFMRDYKYLSPRRLSTPIKESEMSLFLSGIEHMEYRVWPIIILYQILNLFFKIII